MVERASDDRELTKALAYVDLSNALSAENNFVRSGSHSMSTRICISTNYDPDLVIDVGQSARHVDERTIARRMFRALAERLCKEHPHISTDKDIFGGMPHIKNVRLSVGDILAQLYVYGSIQEVVNIYSPDVTEEQIKEAIAYAQDFLETACAPR